LEPITEVATDIALAFIQVATLVPLKNQEEKMFAGKGIGITPPDQLCKAIEGVIGGITRDFG
jgi:hypothetical protein